MTSFFKKTFSYQLSVTSRCCREASVSDISYQLLKTENWKLKTTVRPGYTLIEMLISVSIFSGLLIIVLGSVATSSSSSAKVSVLRAKSQTARTLIDQISNDLRYVDTSIEIKYGDKTEKGYILGRDYLILALRLPYTKSDAELVRKEYVIKTIGDDSRLTITLKEGRGCQKDNNLFFTNCALQSKETDLLSSAYVLNDSTDFTSGFAGITVNEAANKYTPPISPSIGMVFTVKPLEFSNKSCGDLDSGTCYKVSTRLNMGTFQREGEL